MPKTRSLPSELAFRKRSQRERTQRSLQSRLDRERNEKTWLDRLHQPPKWWRKGKQLNMRSVERGGKISAYIPSREMKEVERKIRSKNPDDYAWAEKRLRSDFDYHAQRAILEYFKWRPHSPYSFEMLYTRILERHYLNFLEKAKENLGRAKYILASIRLAIGPSDRLIKNFEMSNLPRTDRMGEQEKAKFGNESIELRGLLPPRIRRSPKYRLKVQKLLAGVPEPDRAMILRNYGIGRPKEPMKIIAKDYNISRQAVQQRINSALERIKTNTKKMRK